MTRKTVLITGASDGLGRALAVLLSEHYDLALCGRKPEKMAETLALLKPGADVYQECFDMTDEAALAAFCDHVKAHFSRIDVLVNNAGANLARGAVKDFDVSGLRKMLELNCISQVEMIQQIYPAMKMQGGGCIINVISSSVLFHSENNAAYAASKAAMDAVAKTLLKEAKADNIRVTCVYPGGIDTSFRAVPKHEYLRPETVAGAIRSAIEVEDGAMQEIVIRPLVENNIQ
jgi:NAD(P)-dependent dehydrogenase (short-subunit alcohol dehydrogenase family)